MIIGNTEQTRQVCLSYRQAVLYQGRLALVEAEGQAAGVSWWLLALISSQLNWTRCLVITRLSRCVLC